MPTDKQIEVGALAAFKASGKVSFDDRVRKEPLVFYRVITKAALEAAEAARWQPIETAPKDGTTIHVINERWLQPCPAHFLSKESMLKDYDDAYYMEQGWYPDEGFLFDLPEQVIHPTHWQPLPQPPKEGDIK